MSMHHVADIGTGVQTQALNHKALSVFYAQMLIFPFFKPLEAPHPAQTGKIQLQRMRIQIVE